MLQTAIQHSFVKSIFRFQGHSVCQHCFIHLISGDGTFRIEKPANFAKTKKKARSRVESSLFPTSFESKIDPYSIRRKCGIQNATKTPRRSSARSALKALIRAFCRAAIPTHAVPSIRPNRRRKTSNPRSLRAR